ncbi:MAG: YicC/YloC family endoribonuclease [bacterium]
MVRTPIRSMTGFGDAARSVPAGTLGVEIRTVNHRHLNLHLRTPDGFERWHPAIEGALRLRFVRGNVTARVTLTETEGEASVPVNVPRARAYRDALRHLQETLGLGDTVDVGLVAGFREVFQGDERRGPPPELSESDVVEVVEEAADRVLAMREEEGQRLAEDLGSRLEAMEREVDAIAQRAPARLVAERDRLREQIDALLGEDVSVDEDRLAREVAHLAERWDIHEEIVRFRSHVRMFQDTLEEGSDEGVGKRFGFIAQEILRETNTMGSKANDAEIAARVVTLKEEVERLREQLENVE